MSPRAACRLETLGFTAVYDYAAGKSDWLASGLPTDGTMANQPRAGTIASKDVPTCKLDDTVAIARSRVKASAADGCVVVSDTGVVLGVLAPAILSGVGTLRVEEVMRPGPATVRANEDLAGLLDRMDARKVDSVLVTDPEGRLLGVLRRSDVAVIVGSREQT